MSAAYLVYSAIALIPTPFSGKAIRQSCLTQRVEPVSPLCADHLVRFAHAVGYSHVESADHAAKMVLDLRPNLEALERELSAVLVEVETRDALEAELRRTKTTWLKGGWGD